MRTITYQRWEKCSRYYELYLARDLFGQWVVTRCWGRRNSALGQVRHIPVFDYQAGLLHLQTYMRQRLQHGYQRVL